MSKLSKPNKPKKTARLEIRVTEEYKQNIETAAYLQGQNMTEYVLDVLAKASDRTIRQHQILKLSKRDSEHFVDALLNPSFPSQQAIDDAEWYKKTIKCNDRES